MGRRPRIALLDAARYSDNNRRNWRRELDADLVEFDVMSGDLPDGFEFDGVAITGSKVGVYEDKVWIDDLVAWTAEAVEHGLPGLGVCFGHQTFAAALGGRVEPMGDYEVGYTEFEPRVDDELFAGIDSPFLAFSTHGDAVVELPPDATLLVENEYGVQGFRQGEVWGVQFHPEYDLETVHDLLERKRDDDRLTDKEIDAALAGATEAAYERACRTKRLFDNFLEHVRTRESRAEPAD